MNKMRSAYNTFLIRKWQWQGEMLQRFSPSKRKMRQENDFLEDYILSAQYVEVCGTEGMMVTGGDGHGCVEGIDLVTGEARSGDIWHCGPLRMEPSTAVRIALMKIQHPQMWTDIGWQATNILYDSDDTGEVLASRTPEQVLRMLQNLKEPTEDTFDGDVSRWEEEGGTAP